MRYYLDDLKIIVKFWNNGEKGEKYFWLYHQTEWEDFWTVTRQVHLKSADERVDNSESLLRSIQTSAYRSQRKAYQPQRSSFVWVTCIFFPLFTSAQRWEPKKTYKKWPGISSGNGNHCRPASLPAPADDFIVHIVDGMAFIQVHKSTRASTFVSELASTYFIIIAAYFK